MILTGSNIKAVLQAVYGYRWATEAAERFDVSENTVRNWADGVHQPSLRHKLQFRALVREKIDELEKVLTDLAA